MGFASDYETIDEFSVTYHQVEFQMFHALGQPCIRFLVRLAA
jgi:hypothetical protein